MLLYLTEKETSLDFEEVYRQYIKLVLRITNNILNDIHHAQDATQETFIKVYNTMGKFQDQEQLKAWIIVIAKNTAIDFKRKQSREIKQNYLLLDDNLIEETILDMRKNPAEAYLFRETFTQVLEEIFKMDIKYKEVLLLYDYFGFTSQEICNLLDISLENFRVRLHRAKKQVMERLAKKDIL